MAARDLATEALATAEAFGHPVYDALYAITARREGAAVCTIDKRLLKLLKALRIPTTNL
jgi:predicted nucleic acid-binding protein